MLGEKESTNSSSLLRLMEENLEELGIIFLYQEFPVYSSEAVIFQRYFLSLLSLKYKKTSQILKKFVQFMLS